jgi:hypothetical protein
MSPESVGVAFLSAIRSGDGPAVWELLGPAARAYVLDLGERIGVPAEVVGRMRIGTADEADRVVFLGDVVAGLRVDFERADLDRLEVEVVEVTDETARVALVQPIGDGFGPPMPPIPAAWLHLGPERDGRPIERVQVVR